MPARISSTPPRLTPEQRAALARLAAVLRRIAARQIAQHAQPPSAPTDQERRHG